MLQSKASQRVGHNWTTEEQQQQQQAMPPSLCLTKSFCTHTKSGLWPQPGPVHSTKMRVWMIPGDPDLKMHFSLLACALAMVC